MYIAYANTRFSKNSQLIIEQANQIIPLPQKFTLSLNTKSGIRTSDVL